jgi:hypothetical protein
MLLWRRDSARHRLMLVADMRSMRYEVEQMGSARWYVRMRAAEQVWAVGSVDGYGSLHDATSVAEVEAEQWR